MGKVLKGITRATEIGKTSLLPIIGSIIGGPAGAAIGTGISDLGNGQPLGQSLLNSGVSFGTNYLSGGGNLFGSSGSGSGLSSLTSGTGLFGGGGGSSFGGLGGLFGSPADGAGDFGSIISNNASNSDPGFFGSIGNGLSNTADSIGKGVSDAYNGLGFGAPADGTQGFNSIISSNAANSPLASRALSSTGGSGMFGTNLKLGDLLGDLNSYNSQSQIASQNKAGLQNAQNYLNPYYATGTAANTQLGNLLGLNGADAGTSATQALLNDPGYQFRLQQGQTGLDRNLAAQGLGQSGAALKATSDYNQGAAQQEYQQAIQNLSGQSNSGLQAGGALGGLASQIGQVNADATGQQNNIVNNALGSIFGTNQNPLSQLLAQLGRSSYG